MNRIGIYFLLCVGGTSLVLAQERSAPSFNQPVPLAAGQLESVRGVSRSVLSARRNATEDADVAATRETLQALSEAVDAALNTQTPTIVLDSEARGTRRQANAATTIASDDAVRSRLNELKTRRSKLQNRAAQERDASVRQRMKSLSAVASRLETDTQAALSARDRDRLDQLTTLRKRLQPQALNERIQSELAARGEGNESPTPTLITLTEHR